MIHNNRATRVGWRVLSGLCPAISVDVTQVKKSARDTRPATKACAPIGL